MHVLSANYFHGPRHVSYVRSVTPLRAVALRTVEVNMVTSRILLSCLASPYRLVAIAIPVR
jgi:hypothetical protein